MKKFFAVMLALLMTFAVGCSANVEESKSGAASTEVIQYDESAAIATIGDDAVTFGEYKEMFEMYAEYYSMMGYDFSVEETLYDFQDFVVDVLVQEKVIAYQAKEAGFGELSEEDKAEVEASAKLDYDEIVNPLKEQADAAAAEDSSVNGDEKYQELLANETEYLMGERLNEEELKNWLVNYYTESLVMTNFQESILSEVTVSDEEIQEWYDTRLAEDTAAYEENPGDYKDAKENQEFYGDIPVTYAPAGYKRMLHIFITPETDVPTEYSDNELAMDDLKAEYGELAFTVNVEGGEGKARLEEIEKEYNELKKANEKLWAEYYAGALATANEAYAKLQEGAEFETVLQEYSEDQDSRLISNKHVSEYDWSNEVKKAFATLEMGKYSAVIQDDDGCHILYYLSDEPEGQVDLETIKESIREILLVDAQDAEWAELIDMWFNDGSVQLNEELIRSLAYMG